MTSIISSLLYRLKKSTLFWILMAVTALLPLLSGALIKAMLTLLSEIESGMFINASALAFLSETAFPYGDLSLITIIFVSIFLGKEFTSGTMRNTILSAKSRTQMFFGYAVVALIAAFSYTLVFFTGSLLFNGLMFGFKNMSAGTVAANALCILGIALINSVFVVSIVLLFLFGSRKLALTIIMPLVICMFIPSIFLAIVQSIIMAGGTAASDVVSWIPLLQYSLLNAEAIDAALVGKIILMSLLLSGACGAGGYFIFKKADLK